MKRPMAEFRKCAALYFAPLRWLASWVFYLAGDLLHDVAQWSFSMSDRIQNDTIYGPWGPISSPGQKD